MLDYEKVCINAIQVVGKYLVSDIEAADMSDELREAQYTIDDAWDTVELHGADRADRVCRLAWDACNAAKLDNRWSARMHVADFWKFMCN